MASPDGGFDVGELEQFVGVLPWVGVPGLSSGLGLGDAASRQGGDEGSLLGRQCEGLRHGVERVGVKDVCAREAL